MKKKLSILLLIIAACVAGASAQGRRGLRINEVMVQNDSNYVDDYGVHNAWIELYNSTYAPMKIASVYLTTDSANPKMYSVPRGDVNTNIPPRQHVVFWADNEPNRGTFHVNFTLNPDRPNWIGLYDADGETLIDSVTVPANLGSNCSFARLRDGEGSGAEAWSVRDGIGDAYVTPSSNNLIIDTNSKVEMFATTDGNGFGMTIMAMCIVFLALILLSCSFYIISMIGASTGRRNKAAAHGLDVASAAGTPHADHDSGEEIAAIVMALNEHLNAHDHESTILTINRVRKSYSPWSSKIYGLRELPRR